MELKLYNTKSPNNSINKKLENETSFEIRLKDNTNIINPTIKLFSDDMLFFNYAYIPILSRYYFIDSITNFPNKVYLLQLSCDVLESYKSEILNCYAVIGKQENYNNYYDDNYLSEIKKTSKQFFSDVKIDTTKRNNVLITIGGITK